MGGFIKVTLRDKSKITTGILSTNEIEGFLGHYENIFENDISNLITIHSIEESKEITKPFRGLSNVLAPFDYGYIFIDRVCKKAWFINDYTSILHFSNFDFKKDDYNTLKKQKFIVKIKSYSDNKITKINILKEKPPRILNLIGYYHLGTAIPYIKKIVSLGEEIKDISSIETIIDELQEKRDQRNKRMGQIENDLIITEFKDWIVTCDNKKESRYIELFNHMKKELLLSTIDINTWNQEIEDIKDNN